MSLRKTFVDPQYISNEDGRFTNPALQQKYEIFYGKHWSGFQPLEQSYSSVASPPTCKPSCEPCTDQFLPKEHQVMYLLKNPIALHNDKEADLEIKDLLKDINANVCYLRNKLSSYGNTIVKRWKKRPQPRRESLLLTAEPKLYRKKYAEIEIFYEIESAFTSFVKDSMNIWRFTEYPISDKHDVALTPYIDLPTLREDPSRLLSLLHYHTYHGPEEWFRWDCRQVGKYFNSGCFHTGYNPHCMVANGADFGKLVPWEKRAAHGWDIVGYPCARLALQSRRRLTSFLRNVVDLILEHDLSNAEKGTNVWDDLVATDFKEGGPEAVISAYSERAFAGPPRFDLGRLVRLLETLLDAAEDDQWLYQTDPLYARHSIDHAIQQVKEMGIFDVKKHFVIQQTLRSLAKGSGWRWLLTQAYRLREMSDEFGGIVSAEMPLPEDYRDLLKYLDHGLNIIYLKSLSSLKTLIISNPAFKSHFVVEDNRELGSLMPPKMLWRKDPLSWGAWQLTMYNFPYAASPAFLFALIDDLVNSKKHRTRINQRFYDHISELAAIHEAMCILTEIGTRLKINYDSLKTHVTILTETDDDRLWSKLEEFRRKPMPSAALTEESLLQLKNLHEPLDNYWREVGESLGDALTEAGVCDAEFLEFATDVTVGSNLGVKAQLEQGYEQILKAIRAEAVIEPRSCGVGTKPNPGIPADIYNACGRGLKADYVPATSKTKVKTRPEAETTGNATEIVNDLISLELSNEPKKRALTKESSRELFVRMFSHSSAKQGMTRWQDFVSAMIDAGFSATYSGGSSVTFNDERTGQGAITFHRPHPDSSIDSHKLRENAKRLKKHFGLDEDTFFVEQKEDM